MTICHQSCQHCLRSAAMNCCDFPCAPSNSVLFTKFPVLKMLFGIGGFHWKPQIVPDLELLNWNSMELIAKVCVTCNPSLYTFWTPQILAQLLRQQKLGNLSEILFSSMKSLHYRDFQGNLVESWAIMWGHMESCSQVGGVNWKPSEIKLKAITFVRCL